GHNGTVGSDAHRVTIPFRNRLFPAGPPARRAGWQGHAANRLAVGLPRAPVRTPDETFPSKVDLVDTEIIDTHAIGTGADERIEFFVLEEQRHAAIHLIGVIAPGHTLARCRIVRLA